MCWIAPRSQGAKVRRNHRHGRLTFGNTHNLLHQGRDVEDMFDEIVHVYSLNRIVAEWESLRHIAQDLHGRTGIAINPDKTFYRLISTPEIQLHRPPIRYAIWQVYMSRYSAHQGL